MEESGIELGRLLRDDKLTNVPLLVLANKQDLLSAVEVDEIVEEFDLTSRLHRGRAWTIQPCSAKTGDGLENGMQWIIDQLNDESESINSDGGNGDEAGGDK
jgi:ADP-ribosylation factor-like protein 3